MLSFCVAAACSTTPIHTPTGAETFATHCASCHGARGEGDGPVAATLRVPVPDLRRLSARNGGAFPAETVASYIDGRNLPQAHGARNMPVWGGVFDTTGEAIRGAQDAEERIEAVIAYLRELQSP